MAQLGPVHGGGPGLADPVAAPAPPAAFEPTPVPALAEKPVVPVAELAGLPLVAPVPYSPEVPDEGVVDGVVDR